MESCPAEVLSQIFIQVCSDGGRMGGVLRLISKRIAAQAKPYRFWSVCANGVDRIERLEKALLKVAKSQRRVHHLFICDKSGHAAAGESSDVHFRLDVDQWEPEDFTGEMFYTNTDDHEDLRAPRRLTAAQRSRVAAYQVEGQRFDAVFGRLLGLISPHLKSLKLVCFNTRCVRWMEDLRSRGFPRLVHLILLSRAGIPLPSLPAYMPSLACLTLAHEGIGPRWEQGWIQYFLSASDHLHTLTFYGVCLGPYSRRRIHQILGRNPATTPEVSPAVPGYTVRLGDDDGKELPALSQSIPVVRLVNVKALNNRPGAQEWLQSRVHELRGDGVSVTTVSIGPEDLTHLKARWLEMLRTI